MSEREAGFLLRLFYYFYQNALQIIRREKENILKLIKKKKDIEKRKKLKNKCQLKTIFHNQNISSSWRENNRRVNIGKIYISYGFCDKSKCNLLGAVFNSNLYYNHRSLLL